VSRESKVLSAPLPARWSRTQWLKNTLIYLGVRLLVGLLRLLPLAVLWPLGGLLGRLAALVDVSDRRRAEAQIAQAFPELGSGMHRRLARDMFVHLGHSAMETLKIDRLFSGPDAVRLSDEQRALFDAALAEKKGVVVISGHIGNWELAAQLLGKEGYPVAGIAKPLYDPRLTRLVHRLRTRYGMRLIWRGDDNVSREMLRVFADGSILALLIDQDTRVQGEFVPFFGRPAHTPSAPAALALRTGAPVVVGWVQRHGRRHVPHFERLEFTPSGEREADVRALTALMTARLEHAIRLQPAQWVWLHRRWHRQPDAV